MAQQLFSIISLYNFDPTIFDDVVFPASLNKDDVIDNICLSCAELELLYPDIETMRRALTIWGNKSKYSWDKLEKTLFFEYNPIWNKDGTITETRNTNSEQSANSATGVTGFNTSAFQNADNVNSSASADTTETVTRTEQGNIGVVTTQSMIKEEREIAYFNLIDAITEDFKKRFCLLVY